MILLCLDIHAVTGSETGVLKNPIPSLKKELPENPVATLGKRRFDSFMIALTRPQDRSSREKKSLNAAETQVPWRWRNTREIHGEIWPPVTTDHLVLPNEPRSAVSLLPFSQPNSNILRSDCKRAGCGLAMRDWLCSTGAEGVKAEEATPILPIGQQLQKILTKRGSRCTRGRTGGQRLSYKFCKAARAYRCCGKNMPRCGAKIVERMRRYSRVINIT
jgi:hypothetical protein